MLVEEAACDLRLQRSEREDPTPVPREDELHRSVAEQARSVKENDRGAHLARLRVTLPSESVVPRKMKNEPASSQRSRVASSRQSVERAMATSRAGHAPVNRRWSEVVAWGRASRRVQADADPTKSGAEGEISDTHGPFRAGGAIEAGGSEGSAIGECEVGGAVEATAPWHVRSSGPDLEETSRRHHGPGGRDASGKYPRGVLEGLHRWGGAASIASPPSTQASSRRRSRARSAASIPTCSSAVVTRAGWTASRSSPMSPPWRRSLTRRFPKIGTTAGRRASSSPPASAASSRCKIRSAKPARSAPPSA